MLADFPNIDNHMNLLTPNIFSYVTVHISSDVNTQTSQSFLLIFCFDVFYMFIFRQNLFTGLIKCWRLPTPGRRSGRDRSSDRMTLLAWLSRKVNEMTFILGRERNNELNNEY